MGNIIVSGAAVHKAGSGASVLIPEAAYTEWISGAEATINVATRYNWSDAYSTLNEDVKYIVYDTVASLAAIPVVSYDMSGYTSRVEAEDIINVLRDGILRNISILRDIKSQSFAIGA